MINNQIEKQTFGSIMYKKLTLLILMISIWICPLPLAAESDMVDFLGSTGKIYSVVAVICAIFIGIVLFLWRLDRKLTKLENQIDDEK